MINLRWCCAQNLLGSQIPVTTGGWHHCSLKLGSKLKYLNEMINALENKIFPFYHEENMFEDKDEGDIRDENGLMNYKKVKRLILSKNGI